VSGFSGDDLYLAEQSQLSSAAGTNAVASLQAGHPFSLLLSSDERQRNSALETLLDTIADPSTRFARVTNPLRARLTLERLLIQVIQGNMDDIANDPAAIIRRIAERRQDETRVVLVIERAETLHPEVLRFLGRTAALFPDGVPRLQVLFVGRPEFRPLLDDPDSGFDEQTAMLEQYRPATPEPVFSTAPPPNTEQVPQRPLPFVDNSLGAQLRSIWGRGLATRLSIVGGILIGIGAMTFAAMLAFTAPPDVTQVDSASALAEMPEPGASDPDPPVLQPGPAPDEATAALRREFEAYLIASGKSIDGATSAQKRAVYSEFLVWRARTRPNRGVGP
jgi:hypothetical protein